jgi:O-antigen/teichoic acid export membrane protein
MELFNNFFNSKFIPLVDQMLVSLSNFIITLLLIRLLGLEIFGQFSFLWLFLLLINSLQTAYLLSPMLTNAPKQNLSTIDVFYGVIFLQQIVLTIFVFFVVHLIFKFFGDYISLYPVSKYAVSFPLVIVATQLHQFLRRLLFSKKFYFRALLSDFVTYLILFIFVIYFHFFKQLNIETIFWSFFFSFFLGIIINYTILFSLKFNLGSTFKFIKENWIIGRWMLASSLMLWFSGNLWIINAGIILGPITLGVVRACQALIGVANPIFLSFENVVPGESSKKFKLGGINEMEIYLKKFSLKFLIPILILTLFFIIFSKFLLTFVYGLETAKYYYFLIFLSFTLPFTLLRFPLEYALRTVEKTKPIFISNLMTTLIALTSSGIIITQFQLNGLIFGILFSQIISIFIVYLGYLKHRKRIE